jgi:hypothetical protein
MTILYILPKQSVFVSYDSHAEQRQFPYAVRIKFLNRSLCAGANTCAYDKAAKDDANIGL